MQGLKTRVSDGSVEGGEALAQVAQRSCGCPLLGRIQGQVGWSSEHPGLVEDVPAHGRGLEPDDLQGPFQPKPFYDSMTKNVVFILKGAFSGTFLDRIKQLGKISQ